MKVDIYMPIFIGDYLRDTTDLTTEEHGAYFLILMSMWTSGGSLPERKLAAVARVSADRWPGVWETLSRFFAVDDGVATQGRLSEELGRAECMREKARQNGLKGGRPITQPKPDGKPRNNLPVNPSVNLPGNLGHNLEETSSPSDPRSHSQISDPTRSGARARISEPPAGSAWTSHRWLTEFKLAFRVAKAGKFYGAGESDAKATSRLGDLIAEMPQPELLDAQRRAPEMFAEYFADQAKAVADARWCFSFFVTRWNGLRIPNAPPKDTGTHYQRLKPLPEIEGHRRGDPNARQWARDQIAKQEAAAAKGVGP